MKLKSLIAFVLTLCCPAISAQAQEPDRVIMDLDAFLRMYEEARDRPDPEPEAPEAFAVGAASYEGEVLFEDGDPVSVLFKARIAVEVFPREDWTVVPLLPSTVALRSARIGREETAMVVRDGNVSDGYGSDVSPESHFAAAASA